MLTLIILFSIGVGNAWGVSVNLSDIAEANDWETSSGRDVYPYTSWALDANITVSVNDNVNNGSYWSNGWRVYESYDAVVTITAASGYTISSVTITYTSTKNSGCLDGLASGTADNLDDVSSISYEVTHCSGSKAGQVGITAISVTYASSGTTYTVGYVVQPTGAGSVTLGATSLAPNATTSATATANDGYEFSSWEISGTGASLSSTSTNPTTVTMGSADATVTANFRCVTPTWGPNLVTETVNYTTGGSATALTVAASANNATVNYQWQTSTDNTNWSNKGSNSSSNTSLTPSTAAAGTTYYRCIATNAASGCSATATSNVTTVVVSAPTPATITLQNYDGDATTTGYYSGGSFTLPSENDFVCGDLTFVGWSTVAINDPSATKPASNYYEPGESVTLGPSNTFYAVFAESSGSGTTSSSITSYADGTYYLIDSFTDAESNTSYRSPTGAANNAKLSSVDLTTDVSVTNNVLTLDITSASLANAMKYTISRVYDSDYDKYYYRIYNATAEAYVEPNTGTNFKNTSTTPWEVLSENNRFMFWYDASTDRCFLYQDSYSNSGTKTYGRQFGCYAKSGAGTITAQSGKECYGSGYFFLVPATAAATYSNYTTNCVNMRTVYLDATEFGDVSGAKFAIYSWENADATNNLLAEAFMEKVTSCHSDHLYVGEFPDDHDRVIFLRNAPAAVTPVKEGGNKWNQTSNISTDGDKDLFTIASGGAGDSYTGSWSVYTPHFAVTFDKNGAGETTTWPSDQCVANGGKASEPSSPQTMGKTFVGWYQEAEGTNAWVFNTNTVTAATTIYAKWNDVATKTIYLDTDFGDGDDNKWDKENVVIFAHAYIDGTSIYTDVKATSAISSCQPHVYAFTIPGNADYVTFARCATGATSIIWDGGSKNVYNKVSLPVQASKDYYLITGWGSNDVSTGRLETTTFTPVSYTISYNAGTSGSGSRDSESKACGVDFTLPNTQVFTRNGYTMDGWATGNGGDKAYELGGSYTTDADQTFYPHWTEATYTVTLTTNGGTINADNVTSYVYGTGATLPTNVTKDHATFQGWYASSTFEGERVYSIGTTEYGNKQYYAKWEAITYTVTWKANGGIVRTDTEVAEGDKVASVPSAPSNLTPGDDGCSAEFAGWVLEANDPGALSISTQTSTPTGLFTDVAGSPTITGNVTFVAIYRQEQ